MRNDLGVLNFNKYNSVLPRHSDTPNSSLNAKLEAKNEMLTDENEKPIQVTYKFLLPDHEKELKMFQMGQDFLMALWDIKMVCREHWKNGKFETLDEFCEAILEVINALPIEEMYE